MRAVRIAALLIAAIILFDFIVISRGAHVLIPAVVAGIAAAFFCRQDAAAPEQRRMVAIFVCALAGGLAVALALAEADGARFQSGVMALLLICAVPLAGRAIMLSKKRRRPNGLANYLVR